MLTLNHKYQKLMVYPNKITQAILKHKFPITITLIVTFIGLIGSDAIQWLRFDRTAMLNGEVWRLISGHFAHLGWSHLVMNVFGLILIWVLFNNTAPDRRWLIVLLLSTLGTSLLLLWLNPTLQWYVGLSGVLHAFFVFGCLNEIYSGRKSSWILLIVIIVKLIWEQIAGPLPGSEQSAGGNVIVDAHLYGAIIGLLIGLRFNYKFDKKSS